MNVLDVIFNPWIGENVELIQDNIMSIATLELLVMMIILIHGRIKNTLTIRKQCLIMELMLPIGGFPFIFVYVSFIIALPLLIILCIIWIRGNNKATDDLSIYDDSGISSIKESLQKQEKIDWMIMSDAEKAEWKKKNGKDAYKIPNYLIVLIFFLPYLIIMTSMLASGCKFNF